MCKCVYWNLYWNDSVFFKWLIIWVSIMLFLGGEDNGIMYFLGSYWGSLLLNEYSRYYWVVCLVKKIW